MATKNLQPRIICSTLEANVANETRIMLNEAGRYFHLPKDFMEHRLHRYLAEADFRYNFRESLGMKDAQRATRALWDIVGKRLKYNTAYEVA